MLSGGEKRCKSDTCHIGGGRFFKAKIMMVLTLIFTSQHDYAPDQIVQLLHSLKVSNSPPLNSGLYQALKIELN